LRRHAQPGPKKRMEGTERVVVSVAESLAEDDEGVEREEHL
jgi:hypothetical protein